MTSYERSVKEIKLACLEAALRTQKIDIDNISYSLNGPDAILEAAKKYYE